jgi:hypothetical protein
MLGAIMISVIMLTVTSLLVLQKNTTLMLAKCFYCHAECHYDECYLTNSHSATACPGKKTQH